MDGEGLGVPLRQRQRIAPTDDWRQLELLARAPGQRTYELIRPVALFGQSPAERAAETGAAARTLYRQVARFEQLGMASFVPPPKVEKHRHLPMPVRQAIVALKAEHPAFRAKEIAGICAVRFDWRPSPHTVRRILAEEPSAPAARRRFPPYGEIADPPEACLAIVRLHADGWSAKAIAAYLNCSRQQVYRANCGSATGSCWG